MTSYPSQTPPAVTPGQPQQKSNTAKIIIIVVAVLAVLCLIACAVGLFLFRNVSQTVSQSVESDPQDVATASEKIASFDVPAGFEPQSSMSLLGMAFVIYEDPARDSALVAFQMPTSMAMTEENIRTMEEQMQRQSGRQLENFRTVDEYDATIRGKPGKVIIQEGESNGREFRQMLVVFQGKSGLAMLTIMGPTASWDQDAYDQMIQSMK